MVLNPVADDAGLNHKHLYQKHDIPLPVSILINCVRADL